MDVWVRLGETGETFVTRQLSTVLCLFALSWVYQQIFQLLMLFLFDLTQLKM